MQDLQPQQIQSQLERIKHNDGSQPSYGNSISYATDSEAPSPIQWLIGSPSIPTFLKKMFFVLWEDAKLGNYEGDDIQLLMYMFDEWAMLLKWYIPEQRWGNILIYRDTPDDPVELEMDLSILISTLRQMYYINLTKGREGFMVKEMNTQRAFTSTKEEQIMNQNKKMRLF